MATFNHFRFRLSYPEERCISLVQWCPPASILCTPYEQSRLVLLPGILSSMQRQSPPPILPYNNPRQSGLGKIDAAPTDRLLYPTPGLRGAFTSFALCLCGSLLFAPLFLLLPSLPLPIILRLNTKPLQISASSPLEPYLHTRRCNKEDEPTVG